MDAAFLYERIAKAEEVPAIAAVFRKLGSIELEHAASMQEKFRRDGKPARLPAPSWRARVLFSRIYPQYP